MSHTESGYITKVVYPDSRLWRIFVNLLYLCAIERRTYENQKIPIRFIGRMCGMDCPACPEQAARFAFAQTAAGRVRHLQSLCR